MFPYNAQRQDTAARPGEVHPNVQYHYSPQPPAAQQQRQPGAGGQAQAQTPQQQAQQQAQVQAQAQAQAQAQVQQVAQAQVAQANHFYPQQYPYYAAAAAADPKAVAAAGGQPQAGQTSAGATPQAQAAGTTPAPMQMAFDHGMQHGLMPAMASYPQMYPAQGQQQPGEYPYGYRTTNDYVFAMMPHTAAPMQQVHGQPSQVVSQTVTDPTGQAAPPGVKPKVSTTLWEDEGTLCFQVEARGICVARREDNDMINGTKLLNVAGMTRGRRDGLLKGERNRHVIKAGAMHLKGVWIPYDRALDFANKERIIDLLYPLFVTDIKSVLYHPGSREGGQRQDSAAPSQTTPQQPAAQTTPQPAAATPQQPAAQPTPQPKEEKMYPQQYYNQGYQNGGQEFRGYQQGQQYYEGQGEQASE